MDRLSVHIFLLFNNFLNLELSAVSTSRIEGAEKSAREFKTLHAFVKQLICQSTEVNMVVVSVKENDHFDVGNAVISAGKSVY